MVTRLPRIAVTPPAICKDPNLRDRIALAFPETCFNDTGRYFDEPGLCDFVKDADGLIIGRDAITSAVLSRCPQLKIVSKYGVGLDNIDQSALDNSGVTLGWEPGVNRRSVAELTLAFMLSLCHNIGRVGDRLKRGEWDKDGGVELTGKTIGVIGCGFVGKEVVRFLQPFNCRILVHDLLDLSSFCQESGVEQVDRERVLCESDILTLHVPLDDSTRGMISHSALEKMQPTAFLINTSRGGVVDEAALRTALRQGHLAGAALDVFATEPPEDIEFLALPNLIVTPHIGGNTGEAVTAMADNALAHLVHFFKGDGA